MQLFFDTWIGQNDQRKPQQRPPPKKNGRILYLL
jgi:hypothetical protein